MQDGLLCVGADVGVEERTLLLQSTGEASSWKQVEGGNADRKHNEHKGPVVENNLCGRNNEQKAQQYHSVLLCSSMCYLYKCLCCAESSVLRKYLCVEESRAAKIGQGHRSIIHLPLLVIAHCGWPTINTDLCSHGPCGSQRYMFFTHNTFISFVFLNNRAEAVLVVVVFYWGKSM